MAWTTPRTWTTGEVVTAAQMNSDVRDNTQHLFDTRAESSSGSYTGDGSGSRTISLPFTPLWVIVSSQSSDAERPSAFSGLGTGSNPVGLNVDNTGGASGSVTSSTRPELTSGGFIVSGSASSTLNQSGEVYDYLAIG